MHKLRWRLPDPGKTKGQRPKTPSVHVLRGREVAVALQQLLQVIAEPRDAAKARHPEMGWYFSWDIYSIFLGDIIWMVQID